MKRFIYSLFAASALVASIAGCTKDKTEEEKIPSIIVDKLMLNAGPDAQTFAVSVLGNVDWTITSSADWCSASPDYGLGDQNPHDVTVSVTANTEYDDRTATLTVKGDGIAEEISVTQKKLGALLITQNSYEIPADGDTIEVQIASNLKYKIVMPNGVDWIKEIPSSRALDTQTKYYAIAKNETYGPRSTVIRVNEVASGTAKSESITISQAQNNAVLLSTPTFETGAEGGDITVKVKSNIEFTTEILCDWIVSNDSRALTESKLGFKVLPNEFFEQREGKIVIASDVCNDTVTVIQAAFRLDEITFSDRRLKQIMLQDYDTNKDGKIDSDEAAAVTRLELCQPNKSGIRTGMAINSLGGVEYLRNLEYLDMARNSVAKIDLSANKKLKYLDCSLNKAEQVVVPESLTYLDCSHNLLESVEVSALADLEYLDCGENHITTLNVSANSKLRTLACYNNYKMTALDLSGNPELEELLCYTNKIEKLDVSGLKNLRLLNCVYNNLSALDLSANTALVALYCSGNKLTSLSVSGKSSLRSLSCDNNALTTLSVAGCSSLRTLYCWNNKLTSLNASSLTSLEFLGCAHNNLSTLSVTGCTGLRGLYCQDNQLGTLDVKSNTAINNIYCHDNQITSLDLSANTALTGLHAAKNKLAELDLTANTSLTTMYVTGMPTLSIIRLWDECDTEKKYFYKDESASYVGGANGHIVKATIVSNGTRAAETGQGMQWSKGDRINVMSAQTPAASEYILISGEGSATGSFSGSKVDGSPLYAVYPASAGGSIAQNSMSITVPASQQYSDGWGSNVIMVGKNLTQGGDIQMQQLSGIIRLNITGKGTITSIKLESTNGEAIAGAATVTLDGNTPALSMQAGGATSIYVNGINAAIGTTATQISIPVAPVSISNPKVTIYDNSGYGMTLISDAKLDIKSGTVYEFAVAYTPQEVAKIDLSEAGLSNCYIVPHAGSYSFPVKKIDGTTLTGAKADWVWMSDESLISGISYDGSVISFNASANKGNGLVALLDKDGNIVWSWHIWCTDAPQAHKWNRNTWLDRNIGATSVTPDDVNSYGMLYQWGRKDPFVGANTAGSTAGPAEKTAFDADMVAKTVVNESVVGAGNGWANIPGQTTVEQATRYPMCLYTYKYSNGVVTNPANAYGGATSGQTYGTSNPTMADWCVGAPTDRWYNKSVTASGKTDCDPCPAGYMVPTAAQMNDDFIGSKYFTSAGKSSVTNGRSFTFNGTTAWLPATGVRFSAYEPVGANKFIGNTAVYWNSGTGSTASIGAFMSFTSGNIAATCGAVMWKGFACPVRCVAE